MAAVELAALTAPISDEAPCGPDLDLEGDPDYLNYLAKAEGLLPTAYFSVQDGKPFDRANIDFAAEFEASAPLLERTRDLRLMATLAKFHVLNRDIAAFQTFIGAVGTLLDERWDEVHPRGEGGDFTMRMAAIETLDDLPTVVHPLQFVPLANHRRLGVITYRNYMTATGEIRPREDEEQQVDAASIDKALMEVDLPPLVETLNQFETLQAAFGRIRTIWIERAGFEQAVNLDKASQTIGKILALVNGIVTKRDPSKALVSEAGADAGPASGEAITGQVTSRADAAEALAAAAGYFGRAEPSNPALLLVRQAQQLIGRSFIDAMRMLVPAHVEQAFIAIGTQHVFDLPIERLSAVEQEVNSSQGEQDWEEPAPEEASPVAPEPEAPAPEEPPPEEPAHDEQTSAESASDEPASDEMAAEAAPSEQSVAEEQPSENAQSLPSVSGDGPAVPKQRRRAQTRQQAFALLDQVAAYYRSAEPTSPVPFIVERARNLADRDFMSLLKEFLPDSTLRSTSTE